MRITQTMAEAITKKETAKKFDAAIAAADTALRQEVEKEFLKNNKIKFPQDLIDEGYLSMEASVELKLENERHCKTVEMYNTYPRKAHSYSHPLKATKKIETLFYSLQKLNEDRKSFYKMLNNTINSFTTDKALLVHLPELKCHFSDTDLAKSMALVPLETIKQLRKEIVRP